MRTTRRVLLIALLIGALLPLPASAVETASAAEAGFVSLLNGERAAAGAQRLAVNSDLVAAARRQAASMRAAGKLYHTPDLGSVTTGWTALAENVGTGPESSVIHAAFMASSGHRTNILNSRYTHVGVGVVVDDSTIWVAEIFMEGSAPAYTPPFRDDDGSPFEQDIARLAGAGITSGCGAALYCPWASVTRGEMATFLGRGLGLAPASRDHFSDDAGSVHEAAINALAAAGITTGCAPGRFCPTANVSRGEMATFLVRALGLAAASRDYFSDDAGLAVEDSANRLAAAGISAGCAPGRFCPFGAVSREQMATFLVHALGI